jgi:hypothetical protein
MTARSDTSIDTTEHRISVTLQPASQRSHLERVATRVSFESKQTSSLSAGSSLSPGHDSSRPIVGASHSGHRIHHSRSSDRWPKDACLSGCPASSSQYVMTASRRTTACPNVNDTVTVTQWTKAAWRAGWRS